MKVTLEATIPTTQYGNMRPKFELESPEDEAEALEALKRLWGRFGETPLSDKTGGGVEITTFTGETVLWNEQEHTYYDLQGNVLLSGSKYADLHSPKFDMEAILPRSADKWGVNVDELREVWKAKGDVSIHYGNAVHNALEMMHRFNLMGAKIQEASEAEDNYVMPKLPHLKRLVSSFVDKYGLDALPEVVVSDVDNGRAGTIDRLQIVDEKAKTCRVGDYKTNADLDSKKVKKYQKQLSFYAHILQEKGWTVEGLDIFYLDDSDDWAKKELEVLALEE